MLAVSFFTIIFSSLLWLIVGIRYINDSLQGISFFNAGITNILAYVLLISLPLLVMWLIFGYISQYLHNKNVNLQLRKLFGQMKKNQDYSDLLARVMIETENQVKDGFMLGRFDLLIGDMNELLSEIIHVTGLCSTEQIERLWSKVQNGGKWSFGKVVIEINNSQPDFQRRIFDKSLQNIVLGGTVMEFCARYLTLVEMLEKHDKDRVFLNIIETGVMGKVFSIFAPVADEIKKTRDSEAVFMKQPKMPFKAETESQRELRTEPARPDKSAPRFETEPEEKKPLLQKINWFRKKDSEENPKPAERDPFSVALERSFGGEDIEAPRLQMSIGEEENQPASAGEPHFEIEPPAASEEPETTAEEETRQPEALLSGEENEGELSDTQKKLNDLKKEWADLKIDSQPENEKEEENLAYPFGSWTDEDNYRR